MPVAGIEWIWIVVIAAIFLFGAKKVPELAKSIGRAQGEYKKARQEVDHELRNFDSPEPSPPQRSLTPVEKAAKELGIEYLGKPEDVLRKEINNVLSNK